MSTAHVPQQPQPTTPTGAPPEPPIPPHASEATRLLCAGTYLDPGYRDRVIEELHLNEQRIVAPSLGFDAARVLAHALRARRQELLWAGAVLGLWVVGLPLSGGLLALLLWPSVTLALAPWIRGRAAQPPLYRLIPAFLVRWWGRLSFAALLIFTVVAAFSGGSGDDSSSRSYDPYYGDYPNASDLTDLLTPSLKTWQAWAVLVVLVLIGLCLHAQRTRFSRALAAELSPQRFPDAVGDPAEQAENPQFQRLKQRIRLEQHAPLILYNEARPFCGAGAAYDTWVLAVELRPDESGRRQPLSNRTVLEKIRPLLEQLRIPAEFAGPGVRDRLRRLEIDECVFLPAEGLLRRDQAPYTAQAFEEHRARAVEEGAEKRRHFLRIRVGGWEEELVVTVFVRIHTQGRMLMLEVAPHVLTPVREDFKDADRSAHRFRHNNRLGKAATAAVLVPGSLGRSLAQLFRGLVYVWRLLTGGHAGALPDGPAVSVRELGSAPAGSLFQEMDVVRYLRSVQDRVANGVRSALADSGYETGEFVQKIVNISSDVHIGRVEGSTFAVGSHASAASVTDGTAPQKGTDSHGK
ncbi:hypothetical protein [Streptomyces brasiliensis]|uniref:Uncharacterized protein n=1 Tax=Streptomyces brasiliensis TaxID=1954 RepID=A0A917KR00_9ACTN|nr:hypothetical protein [Streptomyces brasiliensis]GGJ20382.1 hypothetical protein GCM10010121_034170 [Streptomyces brasiliensis]